jgi:hypothetical protein
LWACDQAKCYLLLDLPPCFCKRCCPSATAVGCPLGHAECSKPRTTGPQGALPIVMMCGQAAGQLARAGPPREPTWSCSPLNFLGLRIKCRIRDA